MTLVKDDPEVVPQLWDMLGQELEGIEDTDIRGGY